MPVAEVVKYNGGPDVFAWRFPNDELGTWTQLIVNESQEAVLFKGGQALDIFGPGRHTLSTANIPILSRLVNLPFKGKSPFKAEVWYINRIHSLDIKWGTPTPIQIQDPKYGVFIPLRSHGQFGIQVAESKKFLTHLVGTMPQFDSDNLTRFFRGLYLTKVKDSISSYLVRKQISILEINAYLLELSQHLRELISPMLGDYGITLLNFFVNDINVPEDDSAVIKLKDALAKRAEMDIIGFNYHQERSFDTLEGAATNPGAASAGVMGAGLGMGMGFGIGGAMGSQVSGLAQNLNVNETKKCSGCNADIPNTARFCPACGFDTQNTPQNEAASAPGNVNCKSCSAGFSREYKFCPKCSKSYIPCAGCGADLSDASSVCDECGQVPPKPCPGCGFLIKDENKKFCPECGHSLLKKCGGCNNPIVGNPKFCSECGSPTA